MKLRTEMLLKWYNLEMLSLRLRCRTTLIDQN